MKVGYFCNITNWKKKPYSEILDNARDIADYCDKNNWNAIWFTEHHFNHEGMESSPNPLMMCADIAARTKKIKKTIYELSKLKLVRISHFPQNKIFN